jgi:undecaprenyl-diphosphatase
MVSALDAVIFGALQGLLEWLPVSSEGNLVLLMVAYLGLDPGEAMRMAVMLHIGTGVAALVYYRDEAVRIVLGIDVEHRRLRVYLLAMTLVTGLVGLPIYLLLDVSIRQGEALMALTGLALIVTGLIQRGGRSGGNRDSGTLSWVEALGLGVVQGLAIIPGLSRAGVTTTLLLMRGFKPSECFRVSFLMSIPASFAAGFGLMLIEDVAVTQASLISMSVTALTGFAAMGALIKIAQRTGFWKICAGLGALALLASAPSLVSLLAGG